MVRVVGIDNIKGLCMLVTGFFRFQQYFTHIEPLNFPNVGPCLYAMWHNHQCCVYGLPEKQKTNVMVSKSKDGEVVAYAIEHAFGFKTIRGSQGRAGRVEATKALIEAMKNGAIIDRIIVVNDKKKQVILDNDLIKYNISNTIKPCITVILDEKEVMEKYLREYKSFGKGFVIFEEQNGSKEVFIDSFSDNDHVGYITDNEKIIEQLIEKYNTILNAVKDNKLNQYKIN